MDLSIIIVNWNTRDLLRKCLGSIFANAGGQDLEVIVVDNDSADGSREIVASLFPQVKLINSGGNLGFAKANNLGLRQASAPMILFLNPDTEILPASLDRMITLMRSDQGTGALGCLTRDATGAVQELGVQRFPTPLTEFLKAMAFSGAARRVLRPYLTYQDPQRSGYVTKLYGACLLVRRQVLDQAGSFDERFFMYCEDVDLCHRIALCGWKLYYLAEAEIIHLCGSSSSRVPGVFSVLMMCESFSKLMSKYYGGLGAFAYRAVMVAGASFRLIAVGLWALFSLIVPQRDTRKASALTRKYVTTILWAIGMRRAVVPGSTRNPPPSNRPHVAEATA